MLGNCLPKQIPKTGKLLKLPKTVRKEFQICQVDPSTGKDKGIRAVRKVPWAGISRGVSVECYSWEMIRSQQHGATFSSIYLRAQDVHTRGLMLEVASLQQF